MDNWRIAFGEVIHTRLRPVRHAFRYRVFFLDVPVRTLDGQPHGSWLFGVNRAALLSFHESDHGDGGRAMEWIDDLLEQAGIVANGEIRLQTFPRVLGYAFKPVSFWFCHDAAGKRRAIVAEVNNTFGERHCYLLTNADGAPLRDAQALTADKAFHVSPFCPVEGCYRFRFLDNGRRAVSRIDYDDATGPLLATSMSGTYRRLDRRACLLALIGHPWFTAAVMARIHWQALRLWIKRVPWWQKPPPPARPLTHGHR
ncbi:MAG: hypothetical protein RIS35_1716 [Pseudomonadota bacterium]